MSSAPETFAPQPRSPECRKCTSAAVTLTGVLARRSGRPEIQAFLCSQCNSISMFVEENGGFREW